MKKTILALTLACTAFAAYAKAPAPKEEKVPDYKFTTVKENPISPIKNQFRSGTCWCFSSLSFLESELLRTQNKEYNLSEMWVVGHAYSDRAVRYVRMDGAMGFSAGSGFGDVFSVIDRYGIVPEQVYSGYNYGTDKPEQAELDAVLKGYVKAIVSKPNRSGLTTAWKKGFDAVIQAYMGEWPSEFEFEGKTYTPASFGSEALSFKKEDYVNICSFISEPLYKKVHIDVCDNWRGEDGYNVTMDEMMQIMYSAIDGGYTILWGGDVSEEGFSRKAGVATMPVKDPEKKEAGSDELRWGGKDDVEAPAKAPEKAKKGSKAKEEPVAIPAEVEVNDALRQDAYDRKMTTDDHGMHIFGYATDQNGTKYFLVKNSWGDSGKYHGVWYMSHTFIAYKTLNFIVHKDALPKDIREKLGL